MIKGAGYIRKEEVNKDGVESTADLEVSVPLRTTWRVYSCQLSST
jgi:hypothetical protein